VLFGLSAFVPFVLSAFVLLFLAGWKPPHAGEVLSKFSILSLTLLFCAASVGGFKHCRYRVPDG
jgi:NADH:ubiquinone oxidoreductase subunit H